jgi:protein-disulfide isomerase
MSLLRDALRLLVLVGCAAMAMTLTAAAAPDSGALSPSEIAALNGPQALPDVIEGKADAPATIVEYASMTCSHCAAFHKEVWPALKAKYVDSGKAKFVLREFPLDPLAAGAFMLARCAGPGKRDAVVDRLFDHQADWAFTDDPLPRLKSQLLASGMSAADFDACLKNQSLFNGVKAEREAAAKALGVNSTPTFFVSGHRLSGEHSLDKFDEFLNSAGK